MNEKPRRKFTNRYQLGDPARLAACNQPLHSEGPRPFVITVPPVWLASSFAVPRAMRVYVSSSDAAINPQILAYAEFRIFAALARYSEVREAHYRWRC